MAVCSSSSSSSSSRSSGCSCYCKKPQAARRPFDGLLSVLRGCAGLGLGQVKSAGVRGASLVIHETMVCETGFFRNQVWFGRLAEGTISATHICSWTWPRGTSSGGWLQSSADRAMFQQVLSGLVPSSPTFLEMQRRGHPPTSSCEPWLWPQLDLAGERCAVQVWSLEHPLTKPHQGER